MDERSISVIVVDDHEVVRAGLVAVLSRTLDMHIVGTFADAESAIESLDELTPDVVVLDFRLPGMNGAMACSAILERLPSTNVLILTSATHDSVVLSCFRAGARGFMVKNADNEELIAAVRAVAGGRCMVAPEALDSLVRWARELKPGSESGDRLEPHEIAVLSFAAKGMKNREISRRLGITEAAVKTSFNAAKKKLGVRDRSEAVLVGIRSGVI